MKHRRTNRRGHYHRNRNDFPKTFGMSEALGVLALALFDLFKMVCSGIAKFERVRHSVHYNI